MEVQCLTVGMIETNCYLLCDEKSRKCAVIDPGDEARRIVAAIEKTNCVPSAILLTHGHYDHTGAVDDLRRTYPGIAVYLNREDTPKYGAPESLFPAVRDTLHYSEGDAVKVGGLTVDVWSTPGHSRGSVTLRCGTVLFTGDTLFAGDCGRTDLWGGDMDMMLRSLGRLGRLDGNFTVCPGHMETSELDRERQWNPWLKQGVRIFKAERNA